jgi:hypothetical protein
MKYFVLFLVLLAQIVAAQTTVTKGTHLTVSASYYPLTTMRNAQPNWQAANWTNSGITGRTTQCGSTLSPIGGGSDDTSAIQSAINSANPATCNFVLLGPGTFTEKSTGGNPIQVNKSITLRGSGPGTTIINVPNGATLNSDNVGTHVAAVVRLGGSGTVGTASNLTVDAAQGAYSVTVANGAAFSVGDMALLDELANGQPMPDPAFNGGSVSPVASATSCTSSGTALTCTGITGTPVQYEIPICSGCAYDTWIVSGSGGSYVTNQALGANAQAVTFIGSVWAESDYRVMWNQHIPAVNFFDSACVGYANNNNWAASCATNGDECAYSVRCGGVVEELKHIIGVSGNVVTFDSPVMISYRVARTAQLHDYPASSFVTGAAIENMTVQGGDEGNVVAQGCYECWAHKVESTVWLNAGGFAMYNGTMRFQVDFSWVHNAAWPVNGGGGYAINQTYGTSENYIFNNIDMLANKVMVVRASGAGTVFAGNYTDDGYINGNPTWVETGLNCSHLAGSHHMLLEGNMSWNTDNDATHGTTNDCTFDRNWLTGFRAAFTQLSGTAINDSANTPSGIGPLRALGDHYLEYHDSFILNVVGTSGLVSSWTLSCQAGNADLGCAPALYNLGWNDTSVGGSEADPTMALQYPASPTTTVTGPGCLTSGESCVPIVDGNYDYKTNTTQWRSDNPSHIAPLSLYLTSAPPYTAAGTSGIAYPWPTFQPETGTPLPQGCGGSCPGLPAYARWKAGTPFLQP